MFQPVKIEHVKKGQILLRAGEYSKYGYRIEEGCLRSFVLDEKGKEHILQFAPEDWFIADIDGIVNKKPSKIFIEAVENSILHCFEKDVMISTYNMSREELEVMSQKLRNNAISKTNRLISLLSSSSEERYHEFLNTYPDLIQRLPLKLIASYLGMTPEHLSYIRNKITKNS
jgi:CRP-like cAMP-binding protein